ncbi:MAG: redoxin domain-containing protein [Ferruginibacter sp.]|nr:redoxin domain-containing protein [Ferruginibacter sp.]
MKTLFLVVIYTFFYSGVLAQNPAVIEPAYKRIPTIPPYNLVSVVDSVLFTKADLKNKKPVIIMIFSPDCDHCVHATEDLIANINLYKKTQIILVSSLSYKSVQKFYTDLKLANYPNIKVGYDEARFLSSFYEIRNFPSIFLYDKKGYFKEAFIDHPTFVNIAKSL